MLDPKPDNVIEVTDLKRHFRRADALNGVSLTVPRGCVYGLYAAAFHSIATTFFRERFAGDTSIFNSFLVLATLATVALVVIAQRRGLLQTSKILIAIIAAIAASAAFCVTTYWDDLWSAHKIVWNPTEWPLYALLALFLVAPVVTIPLTLHWARHR